MAVRGARACTVLLAALLAGGSMVAPVAAADDDVMNAEIDFLLDEVGHSGCVFVRNGKEHAARAARDHLQMKRKRGRRYYDSAEEFIDRIASRSSMSGKDYRIRCGEAEQSANAWFNAALARYRAADDP